MSAPLLLDLGGRLHQGDRVLPWAPASSERRGTVEPPDGEPQPFDGSLTAFPMLLPLADCHWRETTMERWERQREAGR